MRLLETLFRKTKRFQQYIGLVHVSLLVVQMHGESLVLHLLQSDLRRHKDRSVCHLARASEASLRSNEDSRFLLRQIALPSNRGGASLSTWLFVFRSRRDCTWEFGQIINFRLFFDKLFALFQSVGLCEMV